MTSYNAECELCGFKFIGMSEEELKRQGHRHLTNDHPDEPIEGGVIEYREVPG